MEITNIEVINCTYGKAYILDNVAYDIRFPLNWALHPEKTHEGFICGPSYCQNCFKYGTYKGVFIGYCVICAAVYNYERGNGFINCGEEIASTEYPDTSAWNTYLYGVNRNQIGTNFVLENELQKKIGEQDKKEQENEKETRFRELNLKTEYIIKIIQGSHQKIYQIGTVQYDIHFPLHWALEPMKDEYFTYGPSECNNCLEYGSYRGVFIGYCLNCAKMYQYKKGNGFLDCGVECSEDEEDDAKVDRREAKNSAWNTYLKNVKLEDIGWDYYPPFVDDLLSVEEEDVDKTKEEENCLFRDVESISSDDSIDFKQKSCPSPKYVETTESDDYYDDEFEDDYHDYVDSESEHFYVRGW